MEIKIKKCDNSSAWYKDKIGNTYEVIHVYYNRYIVKTGLPDEGDKKGYFVLISDAEEDIESRLLKLKRYNIELYEGIKGVSTFEMKNPNGRYVKWSDIKKLINK